MKTTYTHAVASLLIAAVLLINANTLTAQRCLPRFEIGVQGGPGISTAYGAAVSNGSYKYDLGYAAGLTLQGNFNRWVGIRSGVMFERRSFRSYETNPNGTESTQYKYFNRFDYMNVPILLQFMTGCKTALVLQGGAFLGFLYHNQRGANELNFKQVNGPGYYTFDGGISVGGGLRIPFLNKLIILSLEARDNIGLAALRRVNPGNRKLYTNHVYLMAGLAVGLGRK